MYSVAPSKHLRRLLSLAILLICGVTTVVAMNPDRTTTPASNGDVEHSIRQDLKNGHANDAIALLQQDLAKNSANAADHDLLCRVYIQEEQWTQAEQECNRAVELEPNNSRYHQWLGRAYGDAAAHASLTSAYSLAKKVHVEFETAVRLDPTNQSALSDLGEYLIDVPRILGGGPAHAESIRSNCSHWTQLAITSCKQKSMQRNRMMPARNESGSWPSRVPATRRTNGWVWRSSMPSERISRPCSRQFKVESQRIPAKGRRWCKEPRC